MNSLPRPKPLAVIILDGWGISQEPRGNAILAADTPVMDSFAAYFPITALSASGLGVGLPLGVAGNSETGHRNIGAGYVQYQILADIDRAIEEGDFEENEAFLGAIRHAIDNNSNIHIMGLVSNGGVHSHVRHLFALLKLLAKHDFRDRVYIHMFTDGRDTAPKSAPRYLEDLENAISKYGVGTIASVTGRFYAMDRNGNWERTQAIYDMLTGGARPTGASSAEQALARAYAHNLTDEKIPTTAITRGGAPVAVIKDKDAVIFFNFRPDRARQLTQAFVGSGKVGFKTRRFTDLFFVTMSEYGPNLAALPAFKETAADHPLARVISEAGLRQLHIAETEKYAHVTYYLNVGHEKPFKGEIHDLVHSSSVRDFARKPEMEAGIITNRLLDEIKSGKYDVFFVNYANSDMVGHTGNFKATVKACAFVDKCLGRLYKAVSNSDGALVITSDHGKAEKLEEVDTHEKFTEHTTNPVPLCYIREQLRRTSPKNKEETAKLLSVPVGVLADVAPTVLDILRLKKPTEMTGISLLGSLR